MATINPIYAVILALVCPREFVRRSVGHDIAFEFERNPDLLKTYPDRQFPEDRRKAYEELSWERTRKIRGALWMAWWSTAVAVAFGFASGAVLAAAFGNAGSSAIAVLQATGAGIILAATLALLGWEIQSYKGQTLPEKANRWIFRAQYWLGTFLFVVSLRWGA